MPRLSSLRDVKELIQAVFEGNEESLQRFGMTPYPQMKAYLIESNHKTPADSGCPSGEWRSLDAPGWYVNQDSQYPETMFLDASLERVWRLYSLLNVPISDDLVDRWVTSRKGLDYCWLSRNQMLHVEEMESWQMRGLGLTFSDGLHPPDEAGYFSLKAWHGAYQYLKDLEDLFKKAKDQFAIYSARWQKKVNDSVVMSVEWYSKGKVTVNRGHDVDEVLAHVAEMSFRYEDALREATSLRDQKLAPFELDYSQPIDLQAFADKVQAGIGDMKLWLVEVETQSDFRRFKGVDLHTWDRVFLDVGCDHAYLTIPGRGCVNAAPRISVVQGEDNAGRTEILYDGVEVFA